MNSKAEENETIEWVTNFASIITISSCFVVTVRYRFYPFFSMGSKRKHFTLSDKINIWDCNEMEELGARKLAEKMEIKRIRVTNLIWNKDELYRQWTMNGNDERTYLKVWVPVENENIQPVGPVYKSEKVQK